MLMSFIRETPRLPSYGDACFSPLHSSLVPFGMTFNIKVEKWMKYNGGSHVRTNSGSRHNTCTLTYLSQLKSQACPVGVRVWLAGVNAGWAAWRTANLDHRLTLSPPCSPKNPLESAAAAAKTKTAEPPAKPQISFKVFLNDIPRAAEQGN